MTITTTRMTCPRCGGAGYVEDDRLIGRELRRRREIVRLSQAEMARRLSVSGGYLSDLEAGRRRWSAILRTAYERALTQ